MAKIIVIEDVTDISDDVEVGAFTLKEGEDPKAGFDRILALHGLKDEGLAFTVFNLDPQIMPYKAKTDGPIEGEDPERWDGQS